MPPDKGVRNLVLEWIAKAEEDIGFAGLGLDNGAPYHGPIAFLAQQCAEKYLKAFLTAHGIEFAKTHDIRELLKLVGTVDADLAERLVDARKLTPYAVDVRYPGDAAHVSPADAKEAFELGSRVRDAVREALRGIIGESTGDSTGNNG